MSTQIAPSLLAADFARLAEEVEMINQSDAAMLHLDIMDGVFVPNISFGFPVIRSIAPLCKKPLDVHLMIVQPEKFIPQVKALGAQVMNVHWEACTHLHRTVQAIRDAGMLPAVTLNPATPVCLLEPLLGELDMILVMTVDPGFGGQALIESSPRKLRRLRRMCDEHGVNPLIEVDGGITEATAPLVTAAGANVLVSGSAVFGAADRAAAIAALRAAGQSGVSKMA